MMMSNEDLKSLARDMIVDFNRLVTTKEERNTQEYLKLCASLVLEELEELDDAILSGNKKDILKELCDVFVVKIQLKDCLDNITINIDEEIMYIDYISAMAEMDFDLAFKKFNPKQVYGAILAVVHSNLSKVPKLEDVKEVYGEEWEEAACNWIEEKYQGRYENIKAYLTGGRVVFREGMGEGKVVKWSGFRDADITPYLENA